MSVFHSLSSSFPVLKADELLKKVVCPQSLPPYVLSVTQYPAETIPTWITNAIKNNRLHHAYILTGIRGVGKTTTARIIAKALN